MSTSLVMLFDAPLQSWGVETQSIYDRPTASMPTLSAVCGLLANALGWERSDDISGLAQGRLSARADRPGLLMRDYQTIGSPGRTAVTAEGSKLPHSVPIDKHYLSDATFLAVYTPAADAPNADELLAAVENPQRMLYFGRMCCEPAFPIGIGTTSIEPVAFLAGAPVFGDNGNSDRLDTSEDWYDAQSEQPSIILRIESDRMNEKSDQVMHRADIPKSFLPTERSYFRQRAIRVSTVDAPRSRLTGRDWSGWQTLSQYVKEAP